MKQWTVDRIEEDVAIIECDGQFLNIPLAFLPNDIVEGDRISIQKEYTSKADDMKDAEDRLKRLKNKNPNPSNIIDL